MIYFAQDAVTNLIKIGHTGRSPKERVALLQTGSASPLSLLGWMVGGRDEEHALHARFAAHHARGEWFRPALPLLQYIGAHACAWGDDFGRLVEVEPALAGLYQEAQAHRRTADGPFCANAVWYGYAGFPGIKPRLERLVGSDALRRQLRTSHAYDVAYDTLYELLPDCRPPCACL
jgi:hypothetical protein